jgi:hypothetical protein
MSGLATAFKAAGVAAKNPRWSWSARSADGKVIVLTLWKDLIDYKARPISYNSFAREDLANWMNRPGNRERLENLIWSRDHCGGLFRVVITTAKDVNAQPREIEDAYYQPRMVMKLVDLNEVTGEFCAVVAEETALAGAEKEERGQSAPGATLQARPNSVEPEYAKLSQEHMARYPKIRAALAE